VAHPEAEGWDPAWHIGPRRDPTAAELRRALGWLVRRAGPLGWLHSRLADDASRELLVDLLAYRVAGGRRVAFGPPPEELAAVCRFAQGALASEPGRDGSALYDLEPLGIDLAVRAAPMFATHTFVLEQYRHPAIDEANVRPGDHVVDGGAFWGDTALWLAEQCAPGGRVTAFEMDPASLPVLEGNLSENAALAERVHVRTEALWHEPARLGLSPAGAATSVAQVDGGAVPATSLDRLLADGEIERVDFVKLDIEGAELSALRGAERAIRRFGPRLAIAIYHHWDDLIEIPRWLDSVAPDYRFALTHRSLHQFDTVLFAWPGSHAPGSP
jgi:FkbM family methyltransferase